MRMTTFAETKKNVALHNVNLTPQETGFYSRWSSPQSTWYLIFDFLALNPPSPSLRISEGSYRDWWATVEIAADSHCTPQPQGHGGCTSCSCTFSPTQGSQSPWTHWAVFTADPSTFLVDPRAMHFTSVTLTFLSSEKQMLVSVSLTVLVSVSLTVVLQRSNEFKWVHK